MSRISRLVALMTVYSASLFTGTASAEDAKAPEAPRLWSSRSVVNATVGVVGYRPGLILEDDTQGFDARHDQTERTRLDADLQLRLPYFEVRFQPYTVVPSENMRVNLAGLEVHVWIAPTDFLKIGEYHHSSHNFSRPGENGTEKYGNGIELDGLALQLTPLQGTDLLSGYGGRYEWQLNGYWFYPGYTRNGSPHVITSDAVISERGTGYTAWRANTRLDAFNALGSVSTGLQFNGSPSTVASVVFDATVQARLSPLGEIGNHLFIGPTFTYGANLDRAHAFGPVQAWLGLQISGVLSDDEDDMLR